MSKHLYQVYDKVSQTVIGPILVEPHAAPAIRQFHDALSAPGSMLGSHPEDFDLLELGEVKENGLILPVLGESPITVATGAAWAAAKEKSNG